MTDPADTYPWPCDRRDAHGPHTRHVPMPYEVRAIDCPGVPAHPATMIGQQRPPEPRWPPTLQHAPAPSEPSTCYHAEPEGECPSCAACAACNGECGTCPYAPPSPASTTPEC